MAPVSLEIVSAILPLDNSIWKTTGILSSLTLFIKKEIVLALASVCSEHPGNAA